MESGEIFTQGQKVTETRPTAVVWKIYVRIFNEERGDRVVRERERAQREKVLHEKGLQVQRN